MSQVDNRNQASGLLARWFSVFSWRVVFLFQKLVVRRKHIKQLEVDVGFKLKEIIRLVEHNIYNSIEPSNTLLTGFVGLGGKNNSGMLVHVNLNSGDPVYISKLARKDLVNREEIFLEWHQGYVKEEEVVSPGMIAYGEIGSSGIDYLVTGYLHHPKAYSLADIVSLYQRLANLSSRVKFIGDAAEKAGMPVFQVSDNTKIKSVICHVVTKLHTPGAFEYALDYLNQRKDAFTGRANEYEQIQMWFRELSHLIGDINPAQYYGLIHGDFKKQNILCDEKGCLRLIDLQYYNYGASLWDLAFFLSKEKESFSETYNRLIVEISLNQTEKWILLFLYIVAALLHVERSNVEKTWDNKLRPALKILDELKQEG